LNVKKKYLHIGFKVSYGVFEQIILKAFKSVINIIRKQIDKI